MGHLLKVEPYTLVKFALAESVEEHECIERDRHIRLLPKGLVVQKLTPEKYLGGSWFYFI